MYICIYVPTFLPALVDMAFSFVCPPYVYISELRSTDRRSNVGQNCSGRSDCDDQCCESVNNTTQHKATADFD